MSRRRRVPLRPHQPRGSPRTTRLEERCREGVPSSSALCVPRVLIHTRPVRKSTRALSAEFRPSLFALRPEPQTMHRPNPHALLGRFLIACLARPAMGVIVPTTPTGTNTVFRAGENCTFSFERDPTGVSACKLWDPFAQYLTDKDSRQLWKSVNVDLFSGSLANMVRRTRNGCFREYVLAHSHTPCRQTSPGLRADSMEPLTTFASYTSARMWNRRGRSTFIVCLLPPSHA